MMLYGQGLRVPLLPEGTAVWNRRVRIEEAGSTNDLQDQINAFLEDLGVNTDYDLGAAVFVVAVFVDQPNKFVALIDYGFYSPT